jgi:hypothetical protein
MRNPAKSMASLWDKLKQEERTGVIDPELDPRHRHAYSEAKRIATFGDVFVNHALEELLQKSLEVANQNVRYITVIYYIYKLCLTTSIDCLLASYGEAIDFCIPRR